MKAIRSRDTSPERRVRSFLHREGLRFRVHRKGLPGSPDIVLVKYGAVIFVNGCFWHQHPGCVRAGTPRTNKRYWDRKLRRNVERDGENQTALVEKGWRVKVVWECEIDADTLTDLVRWIQD